MMKFTLTNEWSADRPVFVMLTEGFNIDKCKKQLPSAVFKALIPMITKADYKAEADKNLVLNIATGKENADVILVGMGKPEDARQVNAIQKAVASVYSLCKTKKFSDIQIIMDAVDETNHEDFIRLAVQTMTECAYRFDTYKSKKCDFSLSKIALFTQTEYSEFKSLVLRGTTMGECVNLAKDLVNEPANNMNPRKLAEMAQKTGSAYNFEVRVHDEKKIASYGMEAFINVAKGSDNQPRLIVMYHRGNPSAPTDIIGLIGKGLTYDSGGYNIKPGDSMMNMKNDMGGAAAVIGAMAAISQAKLPVNVTAVIAACENMISGRAYRPGDIINTMAGKTVEIISTDAEGRLTLIDAIHFAIKHEKVSTIIDVATLTGAAVVALGGVRTAVMTNNDDLYDKLQSAEKEANEKFWRLPTDPEYAEMNKSDVADLKNSGGRWGGAIAAGMFIHEFTQNHPWMHLDIAGTAFTEKPKGWQQKGGTGAPVKSLFYLVSNLIKKA